MSFNAHNRKTLEQQLNRFPRSFRKRLRQLSGLDRRLGDLVVTFPAAAFALVSDYGTPDQRGQTVRLVRGGAGLRDVAKELGLPFWTRKLPPEAFRGRLEGIPDGPVFGARITNFVPEDPHAVADWLTWLIFAARTCDEDFALWVGGQRVAARAWSGAGPQALFPLAAYAWFSARDAELAGRDLVERPWAKNLAFTTAAGLAREWVDRVTLTASPKPKRRGPGRYSQRNGSGGYEFAVLQKRGELYAEGRAMQHCVASYVGLVESGQCLIFSVRLGAQRVATLEVRRRRSPRREFGIVQLQGPCNRPVTPGLRKAVEAWIEKHAIDPMAGATAGGPSVKVDPNRWRTIWRPYVEAKPWLARSGDMPSPDRLLLQAGQLSQVQSCQ